MAEYSNKRKKLADLDDLSREELLGKLKRLVGGGLASARLNNELDEITDPDSDELKDGYQLRFVGKDYARLQAGLATETVVVPNVEHNQKPENKDSQNVFITGDNLDALKHLENSYTGQVDVIYIDPPYNTGTDGFVYQDNFKFSDDDLKLKLGLSDKELGRIRSLNGKSSHSAWLTFMYPRLVIAKRLLKDTGVIFISIDINERANLALLCDAVFTDNNRVGEYIWFKKVTGGYDNDNINMQHEYVLCYSKKYNPYLLSGENRESLYKLTDEDGRKFKWDSLWNIGGLSYSASLDYPIEAPDGTQIWPYGDRGVSFWLWSKDKVDASREKLKFEKKKDGSWRIYKRIYASESIVSGSMLDKDIVKGNTYSSSEIKRLFGDKKVFDYPKPTTLIKYLLERAVATNKQALVLDFFAGSASTGDALMQINANDEGSRQYMLVQLEEPCDPNSKAGKVAIKEGYQTVDEIGRKRLELAAQKIRTEKGADLPANFDGGFKHYVLKKPAVQTLDKIETFEPGLVVHEDMVTPFASTELGVVGGSDGTKTLLTTWLLDDGYKFDDSYEVLMFAGAKAYKADARLYVIDQGWSTASTKELLNQIGTNKLSINTLVLYPYSFDFATLRELKVNLRTNLDEDHGVELVERY